MDAKKNIKPEFGCIGITDSCMLRCKMCHKWKEDIFIKEAEKNNIPTLAQYGAFLGQLNEIVDESFVLNFGGGEALLYPEIFDVVKIASGYGMRTNIASNGFLIDEHVARRIGDSGLGSIKLSLDSLSREQHDYLRGVEGVYDKVMRAIDLVHSYAPKTRIGLCSVIYEHNYREFDRLVEWVNGNEKIEDILVMVPMQPNNTEPEDEWWKGDYGFLWPKDTAAVCALMDKLIDMKEKGFKLNNALPQLKAAKKYIQHPERFVKKTCCNMHKAVHLSSIGQIYLCFQYGILGDIKRGDDIRSIWNSAEAGSVREKIKECKKNCHFLINCFFEEDDCGAGA